MYQMVRTKVFTGTLKFVMNEEALSSQNYSEKNKLFEFPNWSGTHDLREYRLDALTTEV